MGALRLGPVEAECSHLLLLAMAHAAPGPQQRERVTAKILPLPERCRKQPRGEGPPQRQHLLSLENIVE
jgi:hypothetical protein